MQLTFDKIDGDVTTVPCCCDGCAMVGFDVNEAAYDGAVYYHVHTHKCTRARNIQQVHLSRTNFNVRVRVFRFFLCSLLFAVVMVAMAMIVMVMEMVFVTDKNQCN